MDNAPFDPKDLTVALKEWTRDLFDWWKEFQSEQWKAHRAIHTEEGKALSLKAEEIKAHLVELNGAHQKAIMDRMEFLLKDTHAAFLKDFVMWKEVVDKKMNMAVEQRDLNLIISRLDTMAGRREMLVYLIGLVVIVGVALLPLWIRK